MAGRWGSTGVRHSLASGRADTASPASAGAAEDGESRAGTRAGCRAVPWRDWTLSCSSRAEGDPRHWGVSSMIILLLSPGAAVPMAATCPSGPSTGPRGPGQAAQPTSAPPPPPLYPRENPTLHLPGQGMTLLGSSVHLHSAAKNRNFCLGIFFSPGLAHSCLQQRCSRASHRSPVPRSFQKR